MSNEVAIPDYLKKMMAEGSVVDQTSSMQVGGGVPRLTTKGKVFRFKEEDEEIKAGQAVDIVIVGMNPAVGLSHTFYIDDYDPKSSAPPDCSSMNGVHPDPWINNPVNNKCATCPNQSWGSAKSVSGGKAKACRDSKQLYIAKAQDFDKDPKNATLFLLQVTVNSLKAFSNYGKLLGSKGLPGPQFAITRISFDEEASVPKLEFELLGILNEDLGMASHARSEKKEWDSMANSGPLAIEQDSRPSKQDLPDPIATDSSPDPKAGKQSVDELLDQWD